MSKKSNILKFPKIKRVAVPAAPSFTDKKISLDEIVTENCQPGSVFYARSSCAKYGIEPGDLFSVRLDETPNDTSLVLSSEMEILPFIESSGKQIIGVISHIFRSLEAK